MKSFSNILMRYVLLSDVERRVSLLDDKLITYLAVACSSLVYFDIKCYKCVSAARIQDGAGGVQKREN
jgi:hypothetical protein